MQFRTSDNVNIAYTRQGVGYPIVLVSGFGGYQEIWALQVDYLLKMGYQVITYDHRNQGRSQQTRQASTMARLILDLRELITHLKLHMPILIGHSMGASICYGYIEQSTNAAGVIAVDQTPKMLNTHNWHYGFLNATAQNYQRLAKAPSQVHETLNGLDPRVFSELLEVKNTYPFQRAANLALLLDHFQKDWRKTLLATQIPVLQIAAKQSPYYNPDFMDESVQKNNLVSGIKLDGCGHVIMAELPTEFNQLLRHFVLKNRVRQAS
ncbi:alpha/beta fold hydrolase [Pediococcus siamensis]|uniref:alpha/beta fold hydrolase n=1 Tax=Pediococcus siamensis TaxID=381829 RepID=UPI0039A3CFF6